MTLLAVLVAIVVPQPTAHAAGGDDDGCQTRSCRDRVAERLQRRHWRATVRPYRAWIDRTSRCESGGRWTISNPPYSGGMQFMLSSWRAVGGVGYPHRASRLEQMYRAVLLLRLQGRGAWPVCG